MDKMPQYSEKGTGWFTIWKFNAGQTIYVDGLEDSKKVKLIGILQLPSIENLKIDFFFPSQ